MMLGNVVRSLLRRRKRDSSAAAKALHEAREAFHNNNDFAAYGAVERALEADPHEPDAYLLHAAIARRRRQFEVAEQDYREVLRLVPDSSAVRVELAAVLYQQNRFEDALSFANDALAIEPAHVSANVSRGLLLKELGDFEQAEHALGAAIRSDPNHTAARILLAAVLGDQGRSGEARALLSQVLAKNPDNIDAHWTLATIELAAAEWSTAWEHYEHRLNRNDVYLRPRELPWWRPGLECDGALLVLGEQALGDEIMFASCYGDLLHTVAHCHIECDPRLGKIFSRSFPSARIVPTRDFNDPSVPQDHGTTMQIAAGSLPRYFRRDAASFPRHRGYLLAAPDRIEYWRARLAALGPGLNVGISWTGGTGKTRRLLRSLRLDELRPLLQMSGVNIVSLQYTRSEEEIGALARETGIHVHHWPEAIADYDETAALVVALDLVISVTTALVHLSGALGKPIWALVPAAPEWRYLRSGSTMPWYPSARLFRQSVLKNWMPVVESVHAELSAIARAQGMRPSVWG